jgi:hypothetical protein
MRCKCENKDIFYYAHKIRVPLISNKSKFRKFLVDCPEFVNLVSENQRPKFIELLRKIKFFNMKINGQDWTNISK